MISNIWVNLCIFHTPQYTYSISHILDLHVHEIAVELLSRHQTRISSYSKEKPVEIILLSIIQMRNSSLNVISSFCFQDGHFLLLKH